MEEKNLKSEGGVARNEQFGLNGANGGKSKRTKSAKKRNKRTKSAKKRNKSKSANKSKEEEEDLLKKIKENAENPKDVVVEEVNNITLINIYK